MKHPNALSPDFDYGPRILKKVSRSFALTIPQLPMALIEPVTTAYLLCRIADTIEDEAGLSIDQKQHFFDHYIAIFKDELSAHHFSESLTPLLTDQTLPAEHDLVANTPKIFESFFQLNNCQQTEIGQCVETMAFGMMEFQKLQNAHGLETRSQIDDYCYYVAGVVGEMLTGLFCDYSKQIDQKHEKLLQLAVSFGQGLQMTNIIKDLWEDKSRGVCWFPQDIFRKAGFDLATLCAGSYKPSFGEGLKSLIGIAHGHLQNALSYALLLPRCEVGIRKFCIWAVGLALFTLQNIKNNLDYSCSRDVKIPRSTTRRIILVSNTCIRSNFLLKSLFHLAAQGLPFSEAPPMATPPERARMPSFQSH